jgi:hypothetical protein
MWGFIGGVGIGCMLGMFIVAACAASGRISSQEEAEAVRALLAQSEELKEAIDGPTH